METVITIGLKEALCGFTTSIFTIDDRKIDIFIHDIITPDYVKIITDEGLPRAEDSTEKGDLIIKFNSKYIQFFIIKNI